MMSRTISVISVFYPSNPGKVLAVHLLYRSEKTSPRVKIPNYLGIKCKTLNREYRVSQHQISLISVGFLSTISLPVIMSAPGILTSFQMAEFSLSFPMVVNLYSACFPRQKYPSSASLPANAFSSFRCQLSKFDFQ